MLTKLEIKIEKNEEINLNTMSLFQGVLMERIDREYGNFLHISNLKPYTQSLSIERDCIKWIITTLYDEAKEKISKSTEGFYESNKDKVLECSHVIVLCIKSRMDKSHLNKMIEQEVHDCRILNDKNKSIREMVCKNYINIHKYDLKDEQHWMEKQVYLNLGNILLGAELLEIDALPMEGFNKQVLDKELNLREQGYLSSVMVALGYKSNDDFNLSLPKSRFSKEDIFTIL